MPIILYDEFEDEIYGKYYKGVYEDYDRIQFVFNFYPEIYLGKRKSRFKPSSTGEDIMEYHAVNLEHYQHTRDIFRLRGVEKKAPAYYDYFREVRTPILNECIEKFIKSKETENETV